MKMNRFFVPALLCAGFPVAAEEVKPVKVTAVNEAAVEAAVDPFIQKKEIAGAVLLVLDRDAAPWIKGLGKEDLETGEEMNGDELFWIASMTKPMTACAVMQLVEAGKVALDDSVAKFVPEFERLKGADGKPAVITVKQLLTHTSGLDGGGGGSTLAEMVAGYASKPLKFKPGSKWEYCNPGINTLGRIVEVVSGQGYEDYMREEFFAPLEMSDTTFYPSNEQAEMIAVSYEAVDGELKAVPVRILDGKRPGDRSRPPMPAGGLFSTAGDLAQFYGMLLQGGEWKGRRYLKAETIAAMTSPQTGHLKTGFTDGNAWGLGFCVIREPQGVTEALNPGTFGHGGAYGTQAWLDPVKGRAYVLLVQRSNFPNSDASELRKVFQDAASQ